VHIAAASAAAPTILAPHPTRERPCVRALAPCAFLLLNERGEGARATETALPGVYEACLNGSEFLASCGLGAEVALRAASVCDGGRWRSTADCEGGSVSYDTNLEGWLWVANSSTLLGRENVRFQFGEALEVQAFWVPPASANCPVAAVTVRKPTSCLHVTGAARFDWREGSPDWLAAAWCVGLLAWFAHAALGQAEHLVASAGLVLAMHMPLLQRVTYSTYVLATVAALLAGLVVVAALVPRAVLAPDRRIGLPKERECDALQYSFMALCSVSIGLGLSWVFPVY